MFMELDVRLYVKKLKDFFNADKEARKDMFGSEEINMDEFYKMVTDKATLNIKKNGDPMLSSTEMLEIITDLALKDIAQEIDVKEFVKRQQEVDKLFIHIKDGFPPFCLN